MQFHLLPIRDWNKNSFTSNKAFSKLQFHLLPIRDWNEDVLQPDNKALDCNFTYSLLGIEIAGGVDAGGLLAGGIAISLTPY